MNKIFGWDKDTFWSMLAALIICGVIFGLFSHALDYNGQKITGAKDPDAKFDGSSNND